MRGVIEICGESYGEPNWNLCPGHLIPPFKNYVLHGQPTGDFLRAVLENNLVDAVCRADHQNRDVLRELCLFIYNELPSQCWHSKEKVDAWIEGHAEVRRERRAVAENADSP